MAMKEKLNAPCDPWFEAGIPTFPCSRTTKKPVCSWRSKVVGARSHPLNIDEAWLLWVGLSNRAETMMPGLDCEAAGVIVIDLDRNKPAQPGVDGVAEFKRLCEKHNIFFEGHLTISTPSGGLHLFFADPEGRWHNTTSVLAPGVDTRGVGGFVFAPGSERDDGIYKPVQPNNLPAIIDAIAKRSLPPPPPALAGLLDAKCTSKWRTTASSLPWPTVATAATVVSLSPQLTRTNVAGVIDVLSAGINERWSLETAKATIAAAKVGTRNDTMSRMAFTAGLRARDIGLDHRATVDALMEVARLAGWEEEIKTRDTAERQFAEGLAMAENEAGGVATQGAAGVQTTVAAGSRSILRATETALVQSGITGRRDLFKNVVVLSNGPDGWLPTKYEGPLTDNAGHWIAKFLRDRYPVQFTANTVHEALIGAAEHDTFNPVTEWLDGLTWDGKQRFDAWLPTVTGADPTPLNGAAGALIVQGMIMRARWPGSKFDTCVVLEGPQGLGKSSLVAALCDGPGEGYFCDTPGLLAMDGKERGEHLRGKWLVELAELAGLRRREAEDTKAFLSLTADQYRPAYGRFAVEQQRTAVFIGTTNAKQYLQDVTGNRRFVPISCQKIDLEWLRQNRDQIFAEANARVLALTASAPEGKPLPSPIADKLTLPREHWEAVAELTEDRREASPLEIHLPGVLDHLAKNPGGADATRGDYITAKQLLVALETLQPGKINTAGLAGLMHRLGWAPGRVGKGRTRVYFIPQSTQTAVPAKAVGGVGT